MVRPITDPSPLALSHQSAAVMLEDGQPVPPLKDGFTAGVDVAVGMLAVCSHGREAENPKALRAALRWLRQVDKAIARSRTPHGRNNRSSRCNRRDRLYNKRRRIHARIVNLRNDTHHKATTAIAERAGRVVVETLKVSGMLRNRRLDKPIADAGMSGFLAKLEYKCAWYGAEFPKADRWFPSSKPCAHCGWRHGDMSLSDRQWL